MNKVFIVTSGRHSDYGIVGAFSTKEIAETITKSQAIDNCKIKEYELDIIKPFSGWHIQMDRDGKTIQAYHNVYTPEVEHPTEFVLTTYGRMMNTLLSPLPNSTP